MDGTARKNSLFCCARFRLFVFFLSFFLSFFPKTTLNQTTVCRERVAVHRHAHCPQRLAAVGLLRQPRAKVWPHIPRDPGMYVCMYVCMVVLWVLSVVAELNEGIEFEFANAFISKMLNCQMPTHLPNDAQFTAKWSIAKCRCSDAQLPTRMLKRRNAEMQKCSTQLTQMPNPPRTHAISQVP